MNEDNHYVNPDGCQGIPRVLRYGMLFVFVCVPKAWSDDEIIDFAEKQYPCGTTNGWQLRTKDSWLYKGGPLRIDCDELNGFVHVALDA